MEIQNPVTEIVAGFTGVKSAIPHDVLKPSDAEKCINFVTRKMRLRRIWGKSEYANPNLPAAAGRVSWIDSFKSRWAYQQGNAIALENTEGQADFIAIGEILLGEQAKCFSDRWNNNLYLSNGCENKFIEYAPQFRPAPSTALMSLGLTPPGNGAKFTDNPNPPLLVFTQKDAVGNAQFPLPASNYATAADLPACVYVNGPAGDGASATLTANAAGVLTIDGDTPVVGDVILVKNQAASEDCGVYVMTTLGTAGVKWVLTRATYYCNSVNMQSGATTTVSSGVANAGKTFQIVFVGPMVVGTTGMAIDVVASNPSPVGVGIQFGYVITWWDSRRRVESLPLGSYVGDDGFWNSNAYRYANPNPTAPAPNGQPAGNAGALTFQGYNFNINIAAFKAAGYDQDRVTHFIVYRWTQADPHTFKRIADPDNSEEEQSLRIENDDIDDLTPESELGAVLDESLSPPPSGLYYNGTGIWRDPNDLGAHGPRFVKYFRGQLWLFGARYPGTVNGVQEPKADGEFAVQVPYAPQNGWAYASKAGDFDYWQYSFDIGRSLDQADTGLAIHRGTLMFFKDRSAYYLSGSDPTNYIIVPLDIARGNIAPGALQETTKGVIALSADCFSLFDSVLGGKPISDEIADEVAQINPELFEQITSTYDPLEEKYECHVPIENTYNTKVFVYDLKSGVWSFTTRAGGAVAYGLSSKNRIVGLLGDAQTGKTYRVDNHALTTLNGQRIFSSWRSKQFDFGQPNKLKGLQRVIISARSVKDFKISLDAICDMGSGDSTTVEDVCPDLHNDDWADPADACGAVWDSAKWDAAATRKKFTILIQCIGRNIQLVVRNSDTDEGSGGFEIEEIILEASLLDGSEDD